ncbi:MAG TPA: glycosyltransferase family 4 protein [Gemmatimonadaceae bacterium]
MPMHGMRVAFLCSADSFRGSAVSFLHLAQELGVRSAAVRIITGSDEVARPLCAEGVDVARLDVSSTNWRTARALRAELASFDAEVLIVDRPRDLRLGLLATVGSKVALVNRYNSHAPRPPHDFLLRLAYLFSVRDTIFLTHEMSERVLSLAPWMGRAPHRVIPEGVSDQQFRPDANEAAAFRAQHALGDAPFLLSVGALRREKRGEFLIDAVSSIPGAPTLVFCGVGPLRESLSARAERLGVKVRFLGLLPRAELRGAYSAATVLVHACAVETFGLSVLEAMACGCAVVGVRAGGLLEVVGTDGTAGLLIDADDPGQMALAIRSLLDDAALAGRLRVAARERVQSRFSLSRMTEGYERAILAARQLASG